MCRTVIRPGITATNWSVSIYPQIQHGLRADAVEYVRQTRAIWLTADLDARRGQSVDRQAVVLVHCASQGARGRRRHSMPRSLGPARQARGDHLAAHRHPRELVRWRSHDRADAPGRCTSGSTRRTSRATSPTSSTRLSNRHRPAKACARSRPAARDPARARRRGGHRRARSRRTCSQARRRAPRPRPSYIGGSRR